MTEASDAILRLRLANQHLACQWLDDPAQLVAHLGAVQSQDFAAAKWAVALRLPSATDAQVEAAFNAGSILRTHVLRPTWHFVTPADIRWMLKLTAPRISATVSPYFRAVGLDDSSFARIEPVIVRSLEGGRSLTRAELGEALEHAGITVNHALHLGHIMSRAELHGLVCSGPRRGRQHTYALLDERAPFAPVLERDEALAQLTWRYFSSHGPALVQDASWWSGLTVGEIRRGVELNRAKLESHTLDGATYWFGLGSTPAESPPVHLLPSYDEFTVAYHSRDLYYDKAVNSTGNPRQDVPFRDVILADGRVVGRWQRTSPNGAAVGRIQSHWSIEPSAEMQHGLDMASQRYAAFLRTPRVAA
jgi:hypothetical protein